MDEPLEYYQSTARHYDAACAADTRLQDIPFYCDLARRLDGPVLEIACGTGRVLLEIARLNIEIDGIDYTPSLLNVLRAKLAREPENVSSQVKLFEADMRSFSLEKRYRLVIIPFRPLQHLFTVDDQLRAFQRVHEHLIPGGHFAFNVFYPNYQLLDEIGEEKLELEWTDPLDASITVRRSFLRKRTEKLHQFFEGEFIFRSFRGEKLLSEERSRLNLSYYTYPQIELLFRMTGFEIVEEYGSFQKDPIAICKEMIFVARRR